MGEELQKGFVWTEETKSKASLLPASYTSCHTVTNISAPTFGSESLLCFVQKLKSTKYRNDDHGMDGWSNKCSRSRSSPDDKSSPLQLPQVDPHLRTVARLPHPNLKVEARKTFNWVWSNKCSAKRLWSRLVLIKEGNQQRRLKLWLVSLPKSVLLNWRRFLSLLPPALRLIAPSLLHLLNTPLLQNGSQMFHL